MKLLKSSEEAECPFHVRDTRASLAGTIPNVTILWGSWHWAVSGPIGPNLPVFHYPESRPRIPFYLRANWKGAGGALRPFLLSRHKVGRTEKENVRIPPFPPVLPIEARWKRKEHARENIKRCGKRKRKKRESLDPIFRAMPAILVPSDHRCGST